MQIKYKNLNFPLVDTSYSIEEIDDCKAVLDSGYLTMGSQVKQFENKFSQFLNIPHSVMSNSGSSANLLSFAAVTNPLRENHLKKGDKVAVPAVCWSTSLWPIVQMGLIPVLVDVDPFTLNLSIDQFKLAIQKHDIKAIMMVHVLGNSTEIEQLLELVNDHRLILIEDTCESLGSKYLDKYLGTLGEFGTFSFYFSHHMTTIEGGMTICKTQEDYDLLKCLRTHGWSREQSNREELENMYSHIDPRFLFINIGYNLRPMEIQAAFGLAQMNRLDTMNAQRIENVETLRMAFMNHLLWKDQLIFPRATQGLKPCWFGFPFIVNSRKDFLKLMKKLKLYGIDTRPIVSGNMALQPGIRHFNVDLSMGPFVGAQTIHDRGLFIGCHSKKLGNEIVNQLVSTILGVLEDNS
jgi:CDP-4-dehydro-6-deoxyglucose reductase, E1